MMIRSFVSVMIFLLASPTLAAPAKLIPWGNSSDFYAREVLDIADRCSGNDSGKFAKIDLTKLDVKKLQRKLLLDQQMLPHRVCTKTHKQSKSNVEAQRRFHAFMTNRNEPAYECAQEDVSNNDRKYWMEFVANPNNLMVFSSMYDNEGYEEDKSNYSEQCYFHNFYVLRKDGTLVKFTFNYTD